MFLAINEIRHSKLRYALVIGVMFLIAYLVFFLSGLAYGLAQENRMAVDKWNASDIFLSEKANDSLNMSMIESELANELTAKEKAVLAQTAGIIYDATDENKKQNVSFFGINSKEFLNPKVIEGKSFKSSGEVVADISLKKQYHYKIGDKVKLATNNEPLLIAGFTDNAKFNISPVLYTSMETFQTVRYGANSSFQPKTTYNAIVTRGKVSQQPKGLQKLSISKFIDKLPGYSAQVLTFGFMIGFLVVIAAVVIGIFIYVLTMQKIAIFGVMKAQGISSRFIANSVIAQTFILAVSGVTIGLLATIASALILPEGVPFQTNLLFFGVIALLMVLVAIIGALFSVRTIVKIDPLKAIG
ncbi:ABC transporter permease [Lactococcus cremoris]|uniref:ABC transporter permease n=1 Tax=Lactococcus lactis subsp. cremoris TaxID=1359 RepID=UPI0019653A36|nr:ABC transporter permease [Lactococcus cremoris]MCT0497869.1 ABC transporter permease [Lactococcus cremoris]QRZ33591.1 ABC transporter permease [Lactococcus cremoris]